MKRERDGWRDVDEELEFHVERLVEEYREQGMDEAAARRAALRRFGDYAAVERACLEIESEAVQHTRRRDVWGGLLQDVRFAVRQLRAHRLATLIAVLTLALGIGANTAIFSVVNGVLLRPLPYPQADRLMIGRLSVPDYRDLAERNRVFDATTVWASNLFTLRDAERPEELLGGVVEPAFFELLGRPALGRAFDEREQYTPVAVISHGLWLRRWGGDPSVLGRSLDLSGTMHTIIGVMPRGFEYPDARFEVWVPLRGQLATAPGQLDNRALRIFRLIARRSPGVDEAMASADVAAIAARLEAEHPDTNEGVTLPLLSVREQIVGDVRPALLALLGVVGLVLFIACANVASLQIGQRVTRAREMGIRIALGARRGRLIRQLLTESLLLATLGGVVGLLLAVVLLRLLPGLRIDLPRIPEIGLDARVLVFSALASVLTALLFGLAPALQGSARIDPAGILREGGRTATGSRTAGRLRGVLAGTEVALAVLVLVGAGLLIRSLDRVLDQHVGIEPAGLVSMNIGLFHFDEADRRTLMLERVLERVSTVPGVTRVAGGSGLPPETAQRGTSFEVPGVDAGRIGTDGAFWLGVTPGYFATIGTRVVRGREFDAGDVKAALPVAVINAGLARSLFGDADPIGRPIRLLNPDLEPVLRTVVGVVEDIRYQGVEDDFVSAIYTPFAQAPFLWSYLMVRSDVPADRLAGPLREAIGGIDARLVPARVRQHSEVLSDLVAQRRFVTVLLASFALLAVTLAAIGVYGVIASGVAQQRHDIGVRMALGARRAGVIRHIVGRALALVGIGLGIGLLAALWATRLLGGLLYGVGPTDPATFAAGASLILLVGLAASALPALRAAALDPARILRD